MRKSILLICIINFYSSYSQELEQKIADKACECLSTKSKLDDIVYKECITNSMAEVVLNSEGKDREAINTVEGIQGMFKKVFDLMPTSCDNLKEKKAEEKKKLFYSESKNVAAQNSYAIAKDFMNDKKYDLAIEGFLMALKNDKNFVLAYDDIAVCYRQLEDYDKAIKYYKKSLEIYPEGNFALMNMGVIYTKKSDYKTAIEYYEKLIKYHPNDAEGYYGGGKSYFLINNYEKALDNIFDAHIIYSNEKSDYTKDTEQIINMMYQKLKEEKKEDLFKKIAEKHHVNINE